MRYNGNLKEDQVSAIIHIVENDWGIIEMVTWGGKSHIIMAITSLYKKKTLIVTPTKKLVSEMVDKFKEFTNYTPWTYYSDGKAIKDITITTHTSFIKDTLWEKSLEKYDILIVDELDDHCSQDMISAICYSDCNILVWLSWTPSRQELNTQDLELIFWPHIKIWTYQVLPDTITHYVYKRDVFEQATVDYTNWNEQRESILRNKRRFTEVVNTIKNIENTSFLTLVLLDRIEEIERFAIEFPHAVVITWNTKVKDDETQIEQLKKVGGIIIWSIRKMYRGVDIPECDSVVIASPIKFQNTVIQAIGRSLRKCDTKERISVSVINDSILKSQRYQQSKACKEAYNITPSVVFIQSKP